MKLSTKGRYAVMAMVDIAAYGRGRPTSLAQVAARQDISLSYLEQLFAKLRRSGLVRSARGPGGGYVLARSAGEIAIDEIVRAVDEPLRATRCTPGQAFGCHGGASRCLTHDLWEGLGRQIQGYLASVTIADVLSRRLGQPRAAAE
jgi:Rrf2 family iron-sulfur cluster assembly transcriptional regulator